MKKAALALELYHLSTPDLKWNVPGSDPGVEFKNFVPPTPCFWFYLELDIMINNDPECLELWGVTVASPEGLADYFSRAPAREISGDEIVAGEKNW